MQMSVNRVNGPRSRHLTHNPRLGPATSHTIMGRIKIREVRNHDRETKIQQAIEERTKKRTTFRDLDILYTISHSTLSGRLGGVSSRHEAQQNCQAISLAVERSLIRCVEDMDASGFPPSLDLFKATAV